MTKARRTRGGFTLIEVLGAVMIVGIWFLILSSAALQGISAEGRAQHLLEASLIADEALADAETQALLGLPVELDETAYGDVDFDGLPEYEVFVVAEPYDPLEHFAPVGRAVENVPFVDPESSAAAAAQPLAMQRITIDVFFEGDADDPDGAPLPLASRTTFAIDAPSLGLLAVPPAAEPEPIP